jgi:hypothetical protein
MARSGPEHAVTLTGSVAINAHTGAIVRLRRRGPERLARDHRRRSREQHIEAFSHRRVRVNGVVGAGGLHNGNRLGNPVSTDR